MTPEPSDAVETLPRSRSRAVVGAILLASALALTWLFIRAEAVAPEVHQDYTHLLRALAATDAAINAELLASRLELTRNYDTLTRRVEQSLSASARLRDVPSFLNDEARRRTRDAAMALRSRFEDKERLIESFKRDNAVARNSLSFFPVQANRVLYPGHGPGHAELEIYVRDVLAFAREPGADRLRRIDEARARVRPEGLPASIRAGVVTLLRHGDSIAHYQTRVDALTRDILGLDTAGGLEAVNREYMLGYTAAIRSADRYRVLLYALALSLAAYLAFTFVKLDRIRLSLARAHREVSERFAAQLQAEASLRLHAIAFDSAHEGMTLTDAEGNILDVNPAFTRITGFERSEVIGRNPRVLKSGRHDLEFYAAMWKSITEKGGWRGEIWNRNKYGEVYPELLSISAVHDADGRLSNYVAVFSDISRLKEQEKQLTQLAYYDALTELPNRSLLADRINLAMAQTRRSSQAVLAICYLDLDGFKPVNDTWGHDVGDQVLVEMSRRLRDTLRGGDTVARLGGDEFVLLLLGLASEDEARQAVQRLLHAIGQPLYATPEPVSLSASIGVTLFPEDDTDADTLLRHADQAMYRAKQAGKNRYHLFDPDEDRFARSRQDTVDRLREALDNGEFELYFQPKVDMRQGRVVGAEALIRWRHPERGLVQPMDFLPVIEDHELILDVGRWVIRTALERMAEWRAGGLDIPVSVNVAGRQLQHSGFTQELSEALARHPGLAERLELEVLETTALEDVVKVSRVIEECRTLGVRFALDDFGTGYSSLTYLKRLPATTIKIDQSFVREMLHDPHNLVIVQGILGLATAFQRQVVAEGVETPEHGRMLMQLNCDVAQGYGIARPMPADDLPGWVAAWRPPEGWAAVAALRWEADDHPMLVAEVMHRNWVAQLVYAIREGLPVPRQQMADYRHCDFSEWYYGRGARLYGGLRVYVRIGELHRGVHELADEIDRAWRNGQIGLAKSRLEELVAQRDRVIAAMLELELAVGKPD